MDEYNYELHTNMKVLEEVADSLRDMGSVGLEEDKQLIYKGWKNKNGEIVNNICEVCQRELLEIVNNLDNIIENFR